METNEKKAQDIIIHDRKSASIDGVKKLDSFDHQEFYIDTIMGYLKVYGQNLSLGLMNMEKGTLTINGTIDGVVYMSKEKGKNKESFLKKLFK